MSGNKKLSEGNAATQDPDAILTVDSSDVTGLVARNLIPRDTLSKQSLGATPKTQLGHMRITDNEVPTVILNDEEPVSNENGSKLSANLYRSKHHAFSEPDLNQVELYKKPSQHPALNRHGNTHYKEGHTQGVCFKCGYIM